MTHDDQPNTSADSADRPFSGARTPVTDTPFAAEGAADTIGEATELVLAEEVTIDRAAFGFDPVDDDTIDAEFEAPPIPMDVRPVPMKYAAAAAMMLGVLGLFIGRQLDGGPATLMAATSEQATVAQRVEIDRRAGKTYMLYGNYLEKDQADAAALELWALGVEVTVEPNPAHPTKQAVVGTIAFDLTNGLPSAVRQKMPNVINAGFNPEPIHWPAR
ncbi:MAG: hypothetical protein AAF743_17525 [Planctomycetota bacterium]